MVDRVKGEERTPRHPSPGRVEFYHHDGMYAWKGSLPLCVYSVVPMHSVLSLNPLFLLFSPSLSSVSTPFSLYILCFYSFLPLYPLFLLFSPSLSSVFTLFSLSPCLFLPLFSPSVHCLQRKLREEQSSWWVYTQAGQPTHSSVNIVNKWDFRLL